MATRGLLYMTLADWGKRIDPDGMVGKTVELLSQTNPILGDMGFVEGNLPTGHQVNIRTGLPDVTWRKLNYGVQPSKSQQVQVTDSIGELATFSQIDQKIADLNGNTASFRLNEDRSFLEAMNQEMATTTFYGDTDTDAEKFLGLAPRYPYKDGENVIDGGQSVGASTTSIWFCVWGFNTGHGIFPKGSQAGMQIVDDQGGKAVFVKDAATPAGEYLAYKRYYNWNIGLTIRDWRYFVRICNVATSGTGSNIFDPNDLIKAYNEIPEMSMGTPVIYCNKAIKTQIDQNAYYPGSSGPTRMFQVIQPTAGQDGNFGAPVTSFWGVPIKKCDALLNTESPLSDE